MADLRLRLRAVRQERGMSQTALAAAAGTSQDVVSRLETGTSQRLDMPVLDALARALGVETVELFEPATRKPKGKRKGGS